MNTMIQTPPVFNSKPHLAGSTTPRAISDAASDPETSAILPDPAFDSALQDTLPQAPRRMRPLRFAVGLASTTAGMVIILLIGVSMLEVQEMGGRFALPLVALSVLSGVMLLGGGFGLMASASSGFDEREFDRLLQAGNIASSEMEQSATEVD